MGNPFDMSVPYRDELPCDRCKVEHAALQQRFIEGGLHPNRAGAPLCVIVREKGGSQWAQAEGGRSCEAQKYQEGKEIAYLRLLPSECRIW